MVLALTGIAGKQTYWQAEPKALKITTVLEIAQSTGNIIT